MSVTVVELDAAATHALRRSVLRTGTATSEVRFDDDDRDGTFHLGVVATDAATPIAVSTWIPRCYPDEPGVPGVQLRGMATDPSVRGTGVGSLLLRAGLERCRADGAGLVWARARDSAIDFYVAHGFEVRGHGYVDLTTGLPHHDVVRRLVPHGG